MKFHEKTLELNITHELLNLADSWKFFFTDIPLWRYWRPRYKLPFIKYPKATASGFHITTEGKDDPTGNGGGGFDVRIKDGFGKHLLFIQYKLGELITISPSIKSEFNTSPCDHFKFKINGTTTNQHFLLRNLEGGVGSNPNNAVVYAFPLIEDMADLEANSGRLIRKTKFISIRDIDEQAVQNNVEFTFNKEHNFRIGKFDMNRCEVNYYYYKYLGKDRTGEILADLISLNFEKGLQFLLPEIKRKFEEYDLDEDYISDGIRQSFIQFSRYLLHYFEVSPRQYGGTFIEEFNELYFDGQEFVDSKNLLPDIAILAEIFDSLKIFNDFISALKFNFSNDIPKYKAKFLTEISGDEVNVSFHDNNRFIDEGLIYILS